MLARAVAQYLQGLAEALLQGFGFALSATGACRQASHQAPVGASAPPSAHAKNGAKDKQQKAQHGQPFAHAVQRMRAAVGQQRADPPDQCCQQQKANHRQAQWPQQKAKKTFHLLSAGSVRHEEGDFHAPVA
jgi:hypothetical protein